MAGVKGIMHTCCRCPTQIFLPLIDQGVMDGGFGDRWEKYEDLPEEWLYETEFGYLCPECAKEFKKLMTEFLGWNKVISKWRYDGPTEATENENACVGCGTSIPEGQQICPICSELVDKFAQEKINQKRGRGLC